METHAKRGGRGSRGQDQFLSFSICPDLSHELHQKAHRLRKTALIKMFRADLNLIVGAD